VGKLYVDAQPRTSIDGLRQALDQASRQLADLDDDSPQTVQLLRRLDRIEEGLQELASRGADLRVERTRFESLLQQVRRRRRRIVRSSGGAIGSARAQVQPDQSRWWWFLDRTVARERRHAWRRRIGITAAVVALLTTAWLGYQKFLAPPPEIRQAYRHIESGKAAADAGNLAAAMSEFDLARDLTPSDPEPWLWGGALCERLPDCADSETLFRNARSLYATDFDFFLNRGRVYLACGQPDIASADVETAIELNPDSGWGYYLRAAVHVRTSDYRAALDDLQRAADLAERSGDSRLHGMAVTQRAHLVRMHPPETLD